MHTFFFFFYMWCFISTLKGRCNVTNDSEKPPGLALLKILDQMTYKLVRGREGQEWGRGRRGEEKCWPLFVWFLLLLETFSSFGGFIFYCEFHRKVCWHAPKKDFFFVFFFSSKLISNQIMRKNSKNSFFTHKIYKFCVFPQEKCFFLFCVKKGF